MTPLRALTADEQAHLQALRFVSANPVELDRLLRELVVARSVIARVRKHRRCLPAGGQRALDEMPHFRRTSVEYSHD